MLRDYQKQAVKKIEEAIGRGDKKIKVEMAVGTGRFYVLAAVLNLDIVQKERVLVITATNNSCEQIQRVLNNEKVDYTKYEISTYDTAIEKTTSCIEYNMIIFDGIRFGEDYLAKIFNRYKSARFIGFTSIVGKNADGIFTDVQSVFSYSYTQALQDGQVGRLDSRDRIINLCEKMLIHLGCTNLKLIMDGSKSGDIEALLGGDKVVFEIRSYRDKLIEDELIYSCVERISMYNNRTNRKIFVLIMFCIVDKDLKKRIEKEFGVIIWDIKNVKYICSDSHSLSDELAESVRYSLLEVETEKVNKRFIINENKTRESCRSADKVFEYEERLEKCPMGNEDEADKVFEVICTDLIKELFEPALENFTPQKTSRNNIFRIDLICTIKAETGLWWFLKHFYRTNYVVFEFKNYKEQITQNNIVITAKYLNPYTLRNVAIIVSRKGFNSNAQDVAISELYKRGYLIVDITIDELMSMLSKKQSGGKPEELIQEKIDELLMAVDV